MAGYGLAKMSPSSVSHSGTSATINANGGVDFTAVSSLSLNGVFTAAHGNYFLTMSVLHTSTPNGGITLQFRAAGSNATGSDYAWQYLENYNLLTSSARFTSQTVMRFGTSSDDEWSGNSIFIYGPAIADKTMLRATIAQGLENSTALELVGTHSLLTAYDGFTIAPLTGSITGTLNVYGYEE